ncbi:MAG: hypothetical protein WAN11_01955, partial [Syntrophobacteraceae bacterium]
KIAHDFVISARPHKRSDVNWGTHRRSCPDWKHEPTARNVSPGPERSEGPLTKAASQKIGREL